jgi:hypothetical protein
MTFVHAALGRTLHTQPRHSFPPSADASVPAKHAAHVRMSSVGTPHAWLTTSAAPTARPAAVIASSRGSSHASEHAPRFVPSDTSPATTAGAGGMYLPASQHRRGPTLCKRKVETSILRCKRANPAGCATDSRRAHREVPKKVFAPVFGVHICLRFNGVRHSRLGQQWGKVIRFQSKSKVAIPFRV